MKKKQNGERENSRIYPNDAMKNACHTYTITHNILIVNYKNNNNVVYITV